MGVEELETISVVKHVINSMFHILLLYHYTVCLFSAEQPSTTTLPSSSRFAFVCRSRSDVASFCLQFPERILHTCAPVSCVVSEWDGARLCACIFSTLTDIPIVCLSFLFSAVFRNDALRYWIHATLPSSPRSPHTFAHSQTHTHTQIHIDADVFNLKIRNLRQRQTVAARVRQWVDVGACPCVNLTVNGILIFSFSFSRHFCHFISTDVVSSSHTCSEHTVRHSDDGAANSSRQ